MDKRTLKNDDNIFKIDTIDLNIFSDTYQKITLTLNLIYTMMMIMFYVFIINLTLVINYLIFYIKQTQQKQIRLNLQLKI